ncbi:MAG: hypothetical protein Q4D51_00760 [Eubacteriales bacterium]|nr:hypothetical protein [Eubacteriales bacterium]
MRMTEENYDREHDQVKEVTSKESKNANAEEDLFNDDLIALSEMSTKERMSYKWERLQKRLATMEPNEKRKYIIHYYKYHFIVALLALALLIGAGAKVYDNCRPVDLFVMIANDFNMEHEEQVPDIVENAYRARYESPKSHKIEVVESMELNGNVYEEQSYISSVQYWAFIKDDDLDIVVGDPGAMNYMTYDESILPLDEYLPEDIYKQVEDRIVMCKDNADKTVRDGQDFPGAIDISDTEFAKRMALSYKKVYIILPCNRKENVERSVKFIQLVLDDK